MLAGIVSVIAALLEALRLWVMSLPPAWLYATVTVVAFAESAPALGLVVPGQTVIFLAGFLAAEGTLDPFFAAGLVAVGGFFGDLLGFVLGRRRWGASLLRRLPSRLRPGAHAQERLATLFATHGVKAIVLARFQPIGRAFGPYFAGVSGMSFSRFLVADLLASLAAGASLIGLGYLAGLGFERLSKTLGIVAVSVVTVLLIVIVAIGLRVKHNKDKAADLDDLVTP